MKSLKKIVFRNLWTIYTFIFKYLCVHKYDWSSFETWTVLGKVFSIYWHNVLWKGYPLTVRGWSYLTRWYKTYGGKRVKIKYRKKRKRPWLLQFLSPVCRFETIVIPCGIRNGCPTFDYFVRATYISQNQV